MFTYLILGFMGSIISVVGKTLLRSYGAFEYTKSHI